MKHTSRILLSLFAAFSLFLSTAPITHAAIIPQLAEFENTSRCDDFLDGLECKLGGDCGAEDCGVSSGKHMFCNVEMLPDECQYIDDYCAQYPNNEGKDTEGQTLSFGARDGKQIFGHIEGIEYDGNKLLARGCPAYKLASEKKNQISKLVKNVTEAIGLKDQLDDCWDKVEKAEGSEESTEGSSEEGGESKEKSSSLDTDKVTELIDPLDNVIDDLEGMVNFENPYNKSAIEGLLNQGGELEEQIRNAKRGLKLCGEEGSTGGSSDVITGGGLSLPTAGSIKGVSQSTDVEEVGVGIINWALGFVALIAVAILIFGGFMMITARGEESKYELGKKSVIYAVIGILVIMASWTVVNTVLTSLP